MTANVIARLVNKEPTYIQERVQVWFHGFPFVELCERIRGSGRGFTAVRLQTVPTGIVITLCIIQEDELSAPSALDDRIVGASINNSAFAEEANRIRTARSAQIDDVTTPSSGRYPRGIPGRITGQKVC